MVDRRLPKEAQSLRARPEHILVHECGCFWLSTGSIMLPRPHPTRRGANHHVALQNNVIGYSLFEVDTLLEDHGNR
jgi:hypothetical protein